MATAGENLNRARELKGLSQPELAHKAKVSVSLIQRLESGKGATLKNVAKVLAALDEPIEPWMDLVRARGDGPKAYTYTEGTTAPVGRVVDYDDGITGVERTVLLYHALRLAMPAMEGELRRRKEAVRGGQSLDEGDGKAIAELEGWVAFARKAMGKAEAASLLDTGRPIMTLPVPVLLTDVAGKIEPAKKNTVVGHAKRLRAARKRPKDE